MTIKFGDIVPGPKSSSISRLVGAEVTEVRFDGPSLHFQRTKKGRPKDSPMLRFYNTAVIQTKTGRFAYEQPGYADAYVQLLGQRVVEAGSTYESGIRIVFEGGSVVTFLPVEGGSTFENAWLTGFKDRTWVEWRNGDFAYADK